MAPVFLETAVSWPARSLTQIADFAQVAVLRNDALHQQRSSLKRI
jgi:hypothetical protein